jgi:hypothetical protein
MACVAVAADEPIPPGAAEAGSGRVVTLIGGFDTSVGTLVHVLTPLGNIPWGV